jgi:hypothetical protein
MFPAHHLKNENDKVRKAGAADAASAVRKLVASRGAHKTTSHPTYRQIIIEQRRLDEVQHAGKVAVAAARIHKREMVILNDISKTFEEALRTADATAAPFSQHEMGLIEQLYTTLALEEHLTGKPMVKS